MQKSTILIMDDDTRFTTELEQELRTRSCDVSTVNTRTQAEEIARQSKPDLVILGTVAERGGTFKFHQWLRKSTSFRDVSIIIVDAPPEKHLLRGWKKDEGMRLDAEDYLKRPVSISALITRMEKVVEKAADKTTEKIRVLVADDHAVVRDGICAVLALQKDMQVIGEAVDGRDAIIKTTELLPDIVLMDIVMPVMNGLEATKHICSEHEKAKVLILSQYDDEHNIDAGRKAGAVGFIPKKSASSDLVASIRSAWSGGDFIYPVAS